MIEAASERSAQSDERTVTLARREKEDKAKSGMYTSNVFLTRYARPRKLQLTGAFLIYRGKEKIYIRAVVKRRPEFQLQASFNMQAKE